MIRKASNKVNWYYVTVHNCSGCGYTLHYNIPYDKESGVGTSYCHECNKVTEFKYIKTIKQHCSPYSSNF